MSDKKIEPNKNDKKTSETSLFIRTSAEIKAQFNEMLLGGATQTEKFEYLMKIYNENMSQQKYLDIATNIAAIENKFNSVKVELDDIKTKADKWQQSAKEIYIDTIGKEFKLVKDNIEFEKDLREKLETLEKQLEKQIDENSRLREVNGSYDTKTRELENKNAELINKNSDLILDLNEVREQGILNTKKVIELETKLELKTEQYENATKELSELREFKFKYEEVARELSEIKASKDNKLKAKTDEIEKLKAEIKQLKANKSEAKTKTTTK